MAFYKCARIYVTENSNTEINTASGPIANFNTLLATPLLSLKANFKATQDLHGQSGPYPAGGSAQIWDEEWETGRFDITTGENVLSTTQIRSKNEIPILPNTNYYFFIPSGVGNAYCIFFDSNHTVIENPNVPQSTSPSGNSVYIVRTFTTPNNAYYMRFYLMAAYGSTYKNNISINYPSTDTAYHPYSNVCPISGVSEVNVARTGKNLFDKSKMIISTQRFVKYGVDAYSDTLPNGEFNLKANQAYTFTFSGENSTNFESFGVYNEEGTRVAIVYNNKKVTFTPASTGAYFLAFVVSAGNWGGTWDNYNIQLEFGSTKTDYEPFNGSTTLINLGGTYYGGHVEQDKDGKRELVVTHTIGSLAIGANLWREDPNRAGVFYGTVPTSYGRKNGTNIMVCSCFNATNPNATTTQDLYISGMPSYGGTYIFFRNSAWTGKTSQEVNTLLANETIVYELAEPFTVDLPDGEPIKSFPGINNIFADSGDISEIKYRNIVQGG